MSNDRLNAEWDEQEGAFKPPPAPKYPHNALEGFANGCLLDLRVRLAMQMLTHSPRYAMATPSDGGTIFLRAGSAARDALDVATELLAEAETRGLVAPLPSDGELPPELRAQAKLTAGWQVLQQMEGQKFAQREADQVVPVAPRVVGPRNH